MQTVRGMDDLRRFGGPMAREPSIGGAVALGNRVAVPATFDGREHRGGLSRSGVLMFRHRRRRIILRGAESHLARTREGRSPCHAQ